MPIPREQFDKELDQTEYKTLEFLKQYPQEAYQYHEVAVGHRRMASTRKHR